ncbi:MAG: tautomerase family protein [Streptococcaceae bacterium]|nr:tautomerase family protein [Streptococcaceae bacterium]
MPLIKIDLVRGKSDEEIEQILNSIHQAVLIAFNVPKGDRYQIVTQHDENEMILLDTGLGFTRDTKNQIVITVISRKRKTEAKTIFYKLISKLLYNDCQIEPKNILISFVENSDADWSFGFGEAQFITGKLDIS